MSELSVGNYVELLPGREEVYPSAVAGSRGTIRSLRIEDGFEQCYVEWDKDHWRFNGEADGWTFSDHFRQVEPITDNNLVEPQEVAVEAEPPETCPHCGGDHAGMEEYIDSIMQGFDKASEAQGFWLITLNKQYSPEHGVDLFWIDTIRASADEEIAYIPDGEILKFVEQHLRRKDDQ